MFLIGTAHIKKFFKCTPTAKKICFIRQFYFRAEKVILFARNRLRALIVLIFAHDMQIQVPHALCKQGCRLISYTANIRLVTIAACYNCPRSPLPTLTFSTCQLTFFFVSNLRDRCWMTDRRSAQLTTLETDGVLFRGELSRMICNHNYNYRNPNRNLA